MANNTDTNPNVIDTSGADVNIGGTAGNPVTVTSILIQDSTAGDEGVFIDKNGVEILRLAVNIANATTDWSPSIPFTFQNGLTYDDSASSFATGGYIHIFLK